MPKRAPFVHKLLNRLDKIDRQSIQNYVQSLDEENRRYDEVLNHLQVGVLLLDPQGRIHFINRQASFLLSISSRLTERSHISKIQDRELMQLLSARTQNLKEKISADLKILSPREINLRVVLIPLESDSQILALLIPRETVSKEADNKWASIEALVSLAAGIAHEIGNPLNSIGIYLQLLKKEVRSLPEAQRKKIEKNLDVLNTETSRLDKIVKNFLKATRKPPLRFKLENLNKVVDAAVSFLEPELKQKKIRLHVELDAGLPPFLMDHERLHQAFMNLIKNGMEAMRKGGNLSINLSHQDKVASVSFTDEGNGILEKDLPHIFEAYYTTKEEGSGLGLLTVYNAVREHGGRIEVASKVGKGTTFTLYLPIRLPNLQLPQSLA